MISLSKEQLDAAWDKLSPEIREAILSGKVDELANNSVSKYNVAPKAEDVITLCVYAIHGLLDQNLFFNELTALVGPAVSPALAKDIIGSVIIPVLSLRPEEEVEPAPIATPTVQAPTPASSADPVPKTDPTLPPVTVKTPEIITPAPFVIHTEAETTAPVKDTEKSLAEPVRPKFYEEELNKSITPPSYAKLRFATPTSSAKPTETSEMKPGFQEEESTKAPLENNISLKDLPL